MLQLLYRDLVEIMPFQTSEVEDFRDCVYGFSHGEL